jgi:glycosyltransferase involved in cell wall biosynthesis
MNICLVNLVDLDPPRNGGLSRVAYVVCNLLAQWAEEGKVGVYFAVGWRFSGQFRQWLGRSGGEVVPVLPEAGLTPFFETLRPDLVISPLFGMKPISDWKPYKDIPHIASIPDALALDKPELFTAAEAERRRGVYMQLKSAKLVVTLSNDARDRLIRQIGLKRSQVEVVPLAGDLPVSETAPAPDRYQSPKARIGSAPYVLYPARNWPHKRHDFLLRVMREIIRTRKDLKLVLTGWHEEGYLNSLLNRHEFPREKVIDLGFVSNTDMASLYRNAEALLFVSEYEGFGMPLLEAMQNGCPVICAPLTSIPEVGGDAALYVDSENPKVWARAFTKDLPLQRANLVKKGYQQAGKFSWEKTRALWGNVIQRNLGTPKKRVALPPLPSQEMQIWAAWHLSDQEEMIKKEQVIQSLSEGLTRFQKSEEDNLQLRQKMEQMKYKNRAMRAEKLQVQTENKHLREEFQRLHEEVQQLNANIVEKEKVIQKFRTSFIYRMDNGPLRAMPLFPALRWLAVRVRDVRRIFLPKVGVLHQHAPIPLQIPDRYYKTPAPEPTIAPRISIVTPSYNQAAFIERTVKSVLDQGYSNLEYVVQDGGSKDETVEVMQTYIPRLKHFESKKDDGQAHAINLGFQHASGEIMAYLNSDDVLLPGSLNYVADYFAKHPEVDVLYSHRVIIDENDREIGRWILPPHDNDVILWADYVPQETLFWRRSIWEKAGGQMDESYQFALDWDLIVRFRAAGAKFVRIPRFLGAFRVQAAQKTSAHMESSGLKDMRRLRQHIHGRDVEWSEILENISPYLNRSVIYHKLRWLGLVSY